LDPVAEGTIAYWPLIVYAVGVAAVVGGMLGVSSLLGEKANGRAKNEPYESGIKLTGSARIRLSLDFYLFAMFFVIFDLETIYVIAWAIGFQELGWPGYFQMCAFMGTVVVALVYLWRLGALEPEKTRRRV
jgi:NADH-quinone oxidoreductase subunit A